jgi:xanthine dehydrogenase accessory factor
VRLLRAVGDAGIELRARDRARVYAPIGLDLGGESPPAIALSAVAEMQAVLHARPGGSLRERQMPLHTRSETPAVSGDGVPMSCPVPWNQPRTRR